MSFLPISEENKEAPTGQTTNAPGASQTQIPPQTGGSAGTQVGGGAQSKGATTGSPTQFGSSASKLGDYLSANAPQIQSQADTLSGNLNTQYGNLNQGITDAANKFQQSVQGGYAANNPDVVTQAMADPTKFASDPNNVAAFQGQYNNQYTGPTSFEGTQGYGDLQNQVGQAVTQGNLLGSQAGLQSYLQGQGKNPTQAMSTLDSLLLRGNPEAQAQINTAAGQFGNLTGQLGTATSGADQSVLDAQKAAADSQAYAKGQFDPYTQNFGNQITQGANTAEAGRTAYNNNVNQFYSQATPIEQQINAYLGSLGNNAGQGVQDLFAPVIAGNKSVTNPITAQNYSTPEQYQQAAAIQQLLGGTGQLPIGQDTANLASTAPQVPQANLPSMQSLLQQYRNPLSQAMQTGTAAGGPGWTPTASNVWSASGNLANYLNQYDPADYSTTPGSLNGFGSILI